MGHIELRDIDEDDLDAVFEMMCDPEAVERAAFTVNPPDDRAAFDAWIAGLRATPDATLLVVTERGGFAGVVSAVTVDGDREVSFWIKRPSWGRGIATEALRLLISHEPERPLYARAAAHNAAAVAVLRQNGFAEVSRTRAYAPALGREAEAVVFTLPPALDGY